MKSTLPLNQKPITMRNQRVRCWLALAAVIILSCFGNVQGQFQNTVLHTMEKDHYSISNSVSDPSNSVVAETIDRGNLDVHIMEINATGNVVAERIYQTPLNERVFHITPSLNGGYVLCGIQKGSDGFDHGWVLEVDATFNFVNETRFDNGLFPSHTPALHISTSTNDPMPGYIVTGFQAVGYGNAAAKQSYAKKIDAGLNPQWEVSFDANPGKNQDWDMASHGIEVPGRGYFVGGSSTGDQSSNFCDQVVMAAMIDFNGVVTWVNAMEDNPLFSVGHASVGADAFYNASTNEVYQVANYSIWHHFGVNVWDVNSGALNPATSFRVFSSLGYANIGGFRIMESHTSDQFLVAGYIRDAFQTDATGVVIAQGSFPIAAEFNKYSTALIWDEMYPVPSAGYNASSSIYEAFSAGQQPRIHHPKMALRQQSAGGYELVGPHLKAGRFETEILELNAAGQNGCINSPLDLSPAPFSPTFHSIFQANSVLLQLTPGLIIDGISSTEDPCSQTGPCTPNAFFTVTDLGNCCYTFTGLPIDPQNSFCHEWSIDGVAVASGTNVITHCFTTPGIHLVCYTACCIQSDGTVTTSGFCRQVVCEGAPCTPDANFSITDLGNCCYQFNDLTPITSNGPCQQWTISDALGNLVASGPGSSLNHCFAADGVYQICYTDCCFNSDGTISSVTQCQILDVNCCCLPYAITAQSNGCEACVIWATDCPNEVIMVTYDYGDGTFGTNPCHTYLANGIYNICMTACCVNTDGTVDNCITLCTPVEIVGCGCCYPTDFTYTTDGCEVCVSPIWPTGCLNQANVMFDYGDGSGLSTSLCHTYTGSGTYLVCMYVECPGIPPVGIGCHEVTVNCCEVPDFVNFDTFVFDNCEVGFCINPTVDPSIFCATWSFGDGTVENHPVDICPTHTYTCSGVYSVCVTVYCCNDPSQAVTTCKEVQVDCCKLPSSIFVNASAQGCTVTATWGSTDDYCPPLCWDWVLDNGVVISGTDVLTYTFDDCAPFHTICIRVYCCNNPSVVVERCVTVETNCCTLPFEWFASVDQCTACFAPIFEGPCPTDCITWDFGDGTTGTGVNPCHTYTANGVYTVCMTACCCGNIDAAGNIIDPSLCTTICKEVVITDCGCQPVGPFDFNWVTTADNCSEFGFCPVFPWDATGYCATWNFGDGTIVDTPLAFCPIHTYDCAGVYNVCLTIYCCDNPSISSTVCHEITVDCGCKLPSWSVINFANNGCTYDFNLSSTDDYCGNVCVNWDFGDGTNGSGWSSTHTYTSNGVYTVCATVYCCNDPSESYTVCITIQVNCGCCYPADFSFSSQNCGVCVSPIWTVDCPNPANVMFDYGDGTGLTSDLCHTYPSSGTYLVCMYAECPGVPPIGIGCHEVTVNCCCTPNADFNWEISADGCCVTFHDLTPDGNIYGCESWVFGLIQSQLAGDDVTFCFPGSGTYTICHYDCCVDAAGNVIYDEFCIDITLNCGQPCINPAQIDPTQACIDVYDPVCGCDGVTYPNSCYAYYYGGVTSWTPGPCTNGCCLPQDLIYSISDNCCFNFSPLYLVDCLHDGNTYLWDFGDGTMSNLENATHCYAADGIYHVCLTITCPSGASVTYCQDVQRNCSPCPIECDVHAAYNQTIIGKTVSFADNSHAGSGTTITSWFWDFGDGNNSSLQHPTHTYATTGAKTVCLTVTGVNADGTVCTDTYCFVVKIPCPGDFNGDGVVNIADFLTFLGLFNTICP